MSDFQDHFGGHAAAYARARPDYPEALYQWLVGICSRHECAWDCATGSGQAAVRLADDYAGVIATDASPGQLSAAAHQPGVVYAVARSEAPPLGDDSVDLVTVAQALHWFDTAAFFTQAARALRPGGVLAIWGYALSTVDATIDPVLRRFHDERLAPWWPTARWWVARGYPGLVLSFPELRVPPFAMERRWGLEALLAYVATWSGVKRAEAAGEAPMAELRRALAPLWRGEKRVRWPLTVRAARKPSR